MDAGSIGLLWEAILADLLRLLCSCHLPPYLVKEDTLTPTLCPSSIILVYNLFKRLLHETHTYNGPSALEISSAVLRLA